MQEVEYQQDKLRQNLEKIRERYKENKLLKGVLDDYQQFQERLRMKDVQLHENKTAHEQHLQMITAYIQDIMNTNELTETGLRKLDHEHKKILDQIRLLKP